MPNWLQDCRYGLRLLARNPAFTTIAVLTLTLGIGATTAMFSVVHAVLLRDLPYRDPGRLVRVYEDFSRIGFAYNTPAPGNFADWRKQHQVFHDVAAGSEESYNLAADGGAPQRLDGAAVTANLFTVLGANPALGRAFTTEEDHPGSRLAVISQRLWIDRFNRDPNLIGRTISLNNENYTVVGVMPQSFAFPNSASDVWTPIGFTAERLAERGSHYLDVVGRLQPGVTLAKADAELNVLLTQLKRQFPNDEGDVERFFVDPLADSYTRNVRRGIVVLFAAVGFILLIACANIANLLLSRATGRRREMGLRTALGAGRARITRQLLTESALLAIGGGLLGILLANWSFAFLKNLIPADLAGVVSLSLDLPVLAFTVAVALGSSFLFGVAPALQASRLDLNDVLKEGGRGSAGANRGVFRKLMVAGEVALSLTLLVASGLLLESFRNVRGIDPGFQTDHVLTLRLVVPESKYKDFATRTSFFDRVLDRVRTLPGVRSAGMTSALPLTWAGGTNGFEVEGIPAERSENRDANDRVVTPGYFETMRIPLRHGRLINERDGEHAPPVVVINETMARKFWPGLDPIGRRMKMMGPHAPWYTVVGIVGDVRQMRLDLPSRQEMYFPYWQAAHNWMVPRDLVIRTSGDPLSLAAAVRQAVWSIDRDQPISNVATLDQVLDHEVSERRVQALLLGGLSALALVLACIGIYGVLSYLVAQRTQEIGVRVALGANAASIFRTVASEGMGWTAFGMAVGLLGSLALSRGLQSLLFGVRTTDPSAYLGALLVFTAIALLACYVPARRAAKVDPMVALRHE